MTKKRRTTVRYRFESGREEVLPHADVLYRELCHCFALLANPASSRTVRASAEKRLREAAEALAEVELRRARNPPKVSNAQIDAELAGRTQTGAAAKLGITDRQIRNRRNRKP